MTSYFKQLDWNFSFSLLHNKIKEIASDQIHHVTKISEFCNVPVSRLIQEDPFSKIETFANKHGFSIIKAIYRRQFRNYFCIIHTDSFNLNSNAEPATVPFSLNIPLENASSAITRWYNFSTHPELKDENTKFGLIDHKKFTSPTAKHRDKFLKYCIADYTMNSPVIINTSVPHNTDARSIVGDRTILSLWFINRMTNELVTWDQAKFLENIIID
jgi:hypothetical protein